MPATVRARVPPTAPLRWLRLGAADLSTTGYRGLFYGACFLALALAIGWAHDAVWQATMGATAASFLIGPFLCCGVYELSRQRERGEPADLPASLSSWRRNAKAIAFFAVLLVFCLIVWARISVVLFALFANHEYATLASMFTQIFSGRNLEFLLVWAAIGSAFAALVMAISVVSVPMLLDLPEDTVAAVATSARALWFNPLACFVWALLIVLLVGASLTLFLPAIVVVGPWVAHATWHAYRGLVDARAPAGAAPAGDASRPPPPAAGSRPA